MEVVVAMALAATALAALLIARGNAVRQTADTRLVAEAAQRARGCMAGLRIAADPAVASAEQAAPEADDPLIVESRVVPAGGSEHFEIWQAEVTVRKQEPFDAIPLFRLTERFCHRRPEPETP